MRERERERGRKRESNNYGETKRVIFAISIGLPNEAKNCVSIITIEIIID